MPPLELSEKTPGYSATPHRLGPGNLWGKPGFKLPNYIENVAKGLMKSGRDRTQAIQMAIGVCKRWASGGGNVHPEVRAAAAQAIAQWEALKARAKSVKSVKAAQRRNPMSDIALAAPWDGSKHPRGKKGQPNGGKFTAGQARDQGAADAQKDPKAAGNYDAGMRGNPKDVAAQLKGMSDADLQALSKYAYSFKSSDPKVVALRLQLAGALKSRGMDVNNFGGLGKKTGGPGRAAGGAPPAPRSTSRQVVKKSTASSTAAGLSHPHVKGGVAVTSNPIALAAPADTTVSGTPAKMDPAALKAKIAELKKARDAATDPAEKKRLNAQLQTLARAYIANTKGAAPKGQPSGGGKPNPFASKTQSMSRTGAAVGLASPNTGSGDGPKVTVNAAQRKALAAKGHARPDGSFPISKPSDVRKAVLAHGRAKPADRAAVKSHIKRRARALGAGHLIPTDWK